MIQSEELSHAVGLGHERDFDQAERLRTPWWSSCKTERVHMNCSGFMHEMVFPISKSIKQLT
jgi:hypothetical protein